MKKIKVIDLGGVNCYLIKTDDGFVMIDTGFAFKRGKLRKALESAGCMPGNIALVILTHGDSDHTGNCAFLKEHYGAKIVMHRSDSGMVEMGDMLWNRKMKSTSAKFLARILMSLPFIRLRQSDRFKPDSYVEDGQDLSMYGLKAKVLHIPGHSAGSIGVLASGGLLFCGDLLGNTSKPGLFSLIDDPEAAHASVDKLKKLNIMTVYPGHGKPFTMEELLKDSKL